MIPIKLTLQGLYSYQERQTIDFTKLTSAHLFGIFGAVGSGKSAILEAIIFAIYGKTDRLNLSGDNRNYNMMNLKSDDLFIEFVFETGRDQTAYMAVVKGRRNSKKFDDVKTLERTAYRNISGNWVPIEPDFLEKAIGLSYENFKRTIIIPQGQFQEFLGLGNKDRTQMMKELFNLEKFELFFKVTSLEAKNNAQKQHIEGQLQQLGEIDPAQVILYDEQLSLLKRELEEQTKTLAAQQLQETKWQELQVLAKKLVESQRLLQLLKEQEPQFTLLENRVRKYEECFLKFKSLLDALATGNKKIAQKNEQIGLESSKLKMAEEEIAFSETAYIKLKEEYDRRELLRQRAEELGKMARVNTLQAMASNDEERISKGSLILEKTLESIQHLKIEKENLELLIRSEKAKLPDLNVLSQVRIWYSEKLNLNKQFIDNKKAAEGVQLEIQRMTDAYKMFTTNPFFEGLAPEATVEEGVLFLNEKIEWTKRQIASLDSQMEHYRVQTRLEEYAVNLHDGEACPLCGSTRHPAVFNAASVAGALAEASETKAGLENEITLAGKHIIELNDIGNRLKFNIEKSDELLLKKTETDLKSASHTALYHWGEYQDESAVNQAFKDSETIKSLLKEKESALEKAARLLEKEVVSKEKFQVEIDKINTALTIGLTEIKTLSEQLRMIDIEQYKKVSQGQIESEKGGLLQKHALLEKQFTEITTRLTVLRTTKDTLIGSLNALKNELQQEHESNSILQNQLLSRLESARFTSLEEVEQILAQSIDLEREKQKLTDFRQQLVLIQTQTDHFQREMGESIYDSEAHQRILDQMEHLKADVNLKNQELGKVEALLKQLRENLQSQSELRKSLESLELRAENIRTLKALFKGSGFVNYISSVYLQNLCNAANDRFFQLTRQKLSLEITTDNNFQVRDFMNGGKVRHVKTLSGGQTFQAALSLALALADNIQKITESNQNFFFLDEGFGSLDKAALATVFDTLRSLRLENRIVGVISHVEEMQQEIDAHLRIENDEERGSLIFQQ